MSAQMRFGGQISMALGVLVLGAGALRADDPCIPFRAGDGTKMDACAEATIAGLTQDGYNSAVGLLDGMGGEIAPRLIKALSTSEWLTRAAAADALGRMGVRLEKREVIVNALAAHGNDTDLRVRRQVIGALGRIGLKTAAADNAIREAETDGDPMVHHLAAFARQRFK